MSCSFRNVDVKLSICGFRKLWQSYAPEDLGVLAVSAANAYTVVDGGVWTSDAAADVGVFGDSSAGDCPNLSDGVVDWRME